MSRHDERAVVIGGGVAGAAAAAHLARSGRPVLLLERQAGPHHKVCGEFVSGDAVRLLRELDIDLVRLGAAPATSVRLCRSNLTAATLLPFEAYGLSRRALDEALLRCASESGAEVRRGRAVRLLERRGDAGWAIGIDGGEVIEARTVLLATGKHELHGWRRPTVPGPDCIGFKLHWRLSPQQLADLGSCVELLLFPGGYGGLQRVENGRVNLCLVIRRGDFAAHGRTWDRVLAWLCAVCPHLDLRLAGATPAWDRPLAIGCIPYGHVERRDRGALILGDQAAVIPSFAGDGIAMALQSARLAARHCVGGTERCFQTRLASAAAGQVRVAMRVSRLLLDPRGQAVAARMARLAPPLMGVVARATRLRASIRQRGCREG